MAPRGVRRAPEQIFRKGRVAKAWAVQENRIPGDLDRSVGVGWREENTPRGPRLHRLPPGASVCNAASATSARFQPAERGSRPEIQECWRVSGGRGLTLGPPHRTLPERMELALLHQSARMLEGAEQRGCRVEGH